MNAFLLACSMLTRVPVHPRGEVTARQLRWSVAFYPWVGLALGGILVACAPLLGKLPVPLLGGVMAVALLALLSGGLHLDGLADWFDAVGGGRGDRTRMLEIMKDPRIGAHGAAALCLVLFAKAATFDVAIRELKSSLWIAPVVSRFAVVLLIVCMKPARNQGLAHSVHGASSLPIVIVALAPVVALCAFAMPWPTCVALIAASGTAAVIGLWAQRRLGGATGDVYGAALELAEVAAVIATIQFQAGVMRALFPSA